jgi:hypothetical protein
MLIYAKLIRKWSDELHNINWYTLKDEAQLQAIEDQYKVNISRLYKRLQANYNMSESEYLSLQEQSWTL